MFLLSDSTRVTMNDSIQSHFYKHLKYKRSSFAQEEMSFLCFSVDQYWHNFFVWIGLMQWCSAKKEV